MTFPYGRPYNIHPSLTGDVIPNNVTWSDLVYDLILNSGPVTSQQITGIDSSITLKIQNTSDTITLYYRIDSSFESLPTSTSGPLTSPWIEISTSSDTIFSINNNQWLSFAIYSTTEVFSPESQEVLNVSNNNTRVGNAFNISTVST